MSQYHTQGLGPDGPANTMGCNSSMISIQYQNIMHKNMALKDEQTLWDAISMMGPANLDDLTLNSSLGDKFSLIIVLA